MLNKCVVFIVFYSFFALKSYGFNPKVIDTLEIHNQIKSYGFDEGLIDFKTNFFSSVVFKNDSTLFYNPSSTLLLFKIVLGDITSVSLMSKPLTSTIGNYNRHLFMFDDVVYSYGGVGLFSSLTDLIYFDFFSGNWLKKSVKNYPFDSNKVLNSWIIGDKIMVLLCHDSELGSHYFSKSVKFSFGEIDLKKFEYIQKSSFESTFQKLLFQSGLGFYRGNYVYDSDLYSLHGYYKKNNGFEYRIFDKMSGSLKRTSSLDALSAVDGFSFLYIKGSEIYYRDRVGKIDSFNVNSGSVIHSKNFFELYEPKNNNKPTFYIVVLALLGLLVFLFIKKSNLSLLNNSSNAFKQELLLIENKLRPLRSTIISKEHLDDLFGISHYSYESIKTKRSRIIKLLNENADIKIERVRKHSDKRFYNYKIY
jgi:hypothetical protein